VPDTKILKLKKEMDDYFANSENIHEKTMYQFFKHEVKSKDIKIAHEDQSIISSTKKTQKYLCAIWKPTNYYKTIPWLRIGIPVDSGYSSIEVVLPVFHSDMPKLWSHGKSYFRLGIKYKIGKQGQTFQLFTNLVSIRDMVEISEIIRIFYRKIKAYDAVD